MATSQILSNFVNTIADSKQLAYTAGASGVVITAFTAANTSNVNASYSAYIISTSTEQPVIPYKIVVWGENDLGIGLVNQIIPAGAELWLETSALDSIYFTATGSQV